MKQCRNILLLALLPVFALHAVAGAEEVPVGILYTTDTHGHVVSDAETIGLDRIAAVKRTSPEAVLLDAGDFLHGTPLAGTDKGASVVRLMCRAGYFAAAAGNHEFSHGLPALRERYREAASHAPPMAMLSANVREADGSPLLDPWAATEVNGIRLCVFGLTTPETKTQATLTADAGLAFADLRRTAEKTTASLRQSGCDLVIALTHIGSDAHIPFTSHDLAASVPGIDAVIDGHSHKEFAHLSPGTTPVVSSGSHGRALGWLRFSVNAATGAVTAVTNSFFHAPDLADLQPDPALHTALMNLRQRVEARLAEVVTTLAAPLPADRATTRTQETALGDLAADAMRAAYGTDIAILNAGSIREGLPQGPVTLRHLAAAFPFANNAVSLRITGAELFTILEHAFSALPGEDGAFPQISGFSVAIAPHAPVGNRVLDITIDGKRLEKNRLLTLATNDFLAQGGDGYPLLAAKPRLQSWMRFETALARHLRQKGVRSFLPENRIREHLH